MVDSVPTRAERVAAVTAILAALLLVPAAALDSELAAVVLLFVAFTSGTIAKARVGVDELLTFGLRSVPDDVPDAERYRKRRARRNERIRNAFTVEYDPSLDRLLALGLVVVGVGGLAVAAADGGDDPTDGRLLIVALIALNGALIAYAASSMGTDDREG